MTVRLCIFLLIWIYGLFALIRTIVKKVREWTQEPDDEQSDLPADGVAFKIMKESLEKIGCQPEVEKEGVTINFAYQGEFFQVACYGPWARIWDPAWSALHADDPNLPMIRDAINKVNITSHPTVVMSTSDEGDIIVLHSRMDIALYPSLPRIEDYVKCSLNALFQTREAVKTEYEIICIGTVEGTAEA